MKDKLHSPQPVDGFMLSSQISCCHLSAPDPAATARDASLPHCFAGLCSISIMLQQTIQLVPQHLVQLVAAGRGCPESQAGPSPCWQQLQQPVRANKTCTGEQVAQGGPGGQGLLRGGRWMVNHGHTVRDPDLWGGQQRISNARNNGIRRNFPTFQQIFWFRKA